MYTLIANETDFIVVDKHAGVSFHTQDDVMGLVEKVRQDLACDLWPVHRLDKATSGLLLLAKSQSSCRELCQLFAKKHVKKFYLAVSCCKSSKLKKKQGLIIGDMERSRRGSWKLSTTKHNPAITQFFSASIAPAYRLFILKPHTGKTHQLRVALKSIGAPILGDARYGDSALVERMHLHAYQLHFDFAGLRYTYESLPKDGKFIEAVKFMQQQAFDAQSLQWPTLNR